MNLKGCGRKWLWSNLKCYHGTCLEGLRTITTSDSRSFGPRYEPGSSKIRKRNAFESTTMFGFNISCHTCAWSNNGKTQTAFLFLKLIAYCTQMWYWKDSFLWDAQGTWKSCHLVLTELSARFVTGLAYSLFPGSYPCHKMLKMKTYFHNRKSKQSSEYLSSAVGRKRNFKIALLKSEEIRGALFRVCTVH
jgi:hypothetical protein